MLFHTAYKSLRAPKVVPVLSLPHLFWPHIRIIAFYAGIARSIISLCNWMFSFSIFLFFISFQYVTAIVAREDKAASKKIKVSIMPTLSGKNLNLANMKI